MPIQFPFRFITGLPPKAQEEIWRDLQAIADGIPISKVYDAYVDPLATSDNIATRTFTTIFAAVQYVADTLGTTMVNIGVFPPTVGSNPVNITETGNYGGTNTCYVQIDAIGAALDNAADGRQSLPGNQHGFVNWALGSFTDSGKFARMQFRGLWISSNLAAPTGPFTNASAELVASYCYFNLNNHARLLAGNSAGGMFFDHCSFQGPSLGGASTMTFDNCFLTGTLATEVWAGSILARNTRFSGMGNCTYTDATHTIMLAACSFTQYSSGTSISSGQLTITSAAFAYIDSVGEESSQQQGLVLIVSAGVFWAWIEGRYWSLSVAAPPPSTTSTTTANSHHIHAECETTFDITGPADIAVTAALTGSFLRGEALVGSAFCAVSSNAGTGLSFVGVKDSVILATFQVYGTVAAGKAYSVDAASSNNTIITAGSQLAPVAPTNSSTTTFIINNTTLFPVDLRDFQHEWIAELTPGVTTYPVPVAAAAVDLRDFEHEWIAELTTGVQTIPTPAPGSAPTGPAGGALGGTYPNPIFAGRNPSGDAMDKDMLPGLLLP